MNAQGTHAELEVAFESQGLDAITRRQRWSELGLVVLIAIVPLIFGAIVSLLHPNLRFGGSVAANLAVVSGLVHQVSCLLLVLYFLNRRGQRLKNLGLAFHWTDPLKALGLTLAGLFLSAILSVLVNWVSRAYTGHAAEMRDPKVIFAGIPLPLFVLYALGASIFEETIVRAYVTSELIVLACPVWLATLISIVVQTSYHVYYGLGGAVALSGVFITFGIYFARSRRLLPVMMGHFFFDLLAIVVNHRR
jgi:membrane protease YdiL (CAAX protease family)